MALGTTAELHFVNARVVFEVVVGDDDVLDGDVVLFGDFGDWKAAEIHEGHGSEEDEIVVFPLRTP